VTDTPFFDAIENIAARRAAAQVMLAALKEIERCNEHYNFGSKLLRIVLPAIAQAEQAGIKVSDE